MVNKEHNKLYLFKILKWLVIYDRLKRTVKVHSARETIIKCCGVLGEGVKKCMLWKYNIKFWNS